MADTVTLREYLDELDRMLENESSTEVVSHCRYILQHFPHNVETYRLLGKALLQKGHHEGLEEYFDEAADVFLRVLSAMPNDYIAHLGLSEIREHENDLDQAIWHLERAYEQLPGNTVLQEAIQDLYARRDGEDHVPEKVQLTRSALARQFANSKLYEQALIELRAAIAQAPQRIDLQVLLAEMLWESGYPVEAGELAVQILKRLPNSIAANRILASLWLEYERPSDAQVFLDRLESLDPYEAARLIQPDADVPDPNRLSRLDYSAKATAELSAETPAWIHDLDDFGEGAAMEDLFLASPAAVLDEQGLPGGPDKIDTEAIFSMSGVTDEQDDWASRAAAAADVPEWFKGIGLGGEGPGPELGAPAFPDDWLAPQHPEAPDEAGESGDVPDWFAEMSSIQPADQRGDDWSAQLDGVARDDEGSPSFDETDLEAFSADWLLGTAESGEQAEPEAAGQPQASSDDLMPDWLLQDDQETLDETPAMSLSGDVAEAEPTRRQDALPPDWLIDDDQADAVLDEEEQPTVDSQTGTGDWLASLDTLVDGQPQADDASASNWQIEPGPAGEVLDSGFTGREQTVATEQPDPDTNWLDALREASNDDELFTLEDDRTDDESWPAADDSVTEETAVEDDPFAGFSDFLAEMERTRQTEDSGGVAGEPEPEPAEWSASVGDEFGLTVDEALSEEAAVGGWTDSFPAEKDTADVSMEESGSEADWLSDLRSEAAAKEMPALADDVSPAGTEVSGAEAEENDLDALRRMTLPPPDLDVDSAGDVDAGAEHPPEWMTEPEYDFFAPPANGAILPVDQTKEDWLDTLDELDTSALADVGDEEGREEPGWLGASTDGPDDDWLGSYAIERPESLWESDAEEEAQEQPAEAVAWPDDLQQAGWLTSEPAADAEADMAESGIEGPLEEDLGGMGGVVSDEAEAADSIAPDEWESLDRGSLDLQASASTEAAEPAWLAEIEPIELEEADDGVSSTGTIDSSAAGFGEDSVGYRSAGDTGVLQPDELPDWMAAFTGEELPDDDLPAETEAGAYDEFSAGLDRDEWRDESKPVTESLVDLTFDEPEYAPTQEDDTDKAGEGVSSKASEADLEQGVMPDWLMAIASSEAGKLDDELLGELEPYSQTAEETGVLQPDATPDWLTDISGPQTAEMGLQKPEAAPDEFAQPDVLSHTRKDEFSVAAAEIEADEAEFDEAIPATFSFDDQPPAWLRRPKESDLASSQQVPWDRASEKPEWLRDVMEEDDETVE